MGIGLSEDEVWDYVSAAHTAVFTTLRRDGWPVSLPTWFVVRDRTIYLKTFPTLRKVARIAHDARGSFLVEDGTVWTELRAVCLYVTAQVVPEDEEAATARADLAVKYPPEVDVPIDRLPPATRAYYGGQDVIVRLTPTDRLLSWDNSRLRLEPPAG